MEEEKKIRVCMAQTTEQWTKWKVRSYHQPQIMNSTWDPHSVPLVSNFGCHATVQFFSVPTINFGDKTRLCCTLSVHGWCFQCR